MDERLELLSTSCCWKSKQKTFESRIERRGSCEEYDRYLEVAEYMLKNNIQNKKVWYESEELIEDAIVLVEGEESPLYKSLFQLALIGEDNHIDIVNLLFTIKDMSFIKGNIYLREVKGADNIIELEDLLFDNFFSIVERDDIKQEAKKILLELKELEIQEKRKEIELLEKEIETIQTQLDNA